MSKSIKMRIHEFVAGWSYGARVNSCIHCGLMEDNPAHLVDQRFSTQPAREDEKQAKELAKLEGKDPTKVAKEMAAALAREHGLTKPLEMKHNQVPGPDIRLNGDQRVGTWCLWCEYVSDHIDELEAHMKEHVLAGYLKPITLNALLKWLGAPKVEHGEILIQIVSRPGNDISKIPSS
jgi:hypothetical protein